MPHLKPKLTTLTILALGAANLYTASLAQDADLSIETDHAPKIDEIFIGADLDGDGALNANEHRLYLDHHGQDSGSNATATQKEGPYLSAFNKADKDGDGLVTYLEITSAADSSAEDTDESGEDDGNADPLIDIPQDE